jgi:hypothetical protein
MIMGTIGALANGASFPLLLIFFANMIDLGIDYTSMTNSDGKNCTILRNVTTSLNYSIPRTPMDFVENMGQQAINLTSKRKYKN